MGFFGSVNQKNVNLKKAIVNYTKTNLSNASQVKNAMNKIIISWRNQTGATPSQAPLVTNSLMNRIRGGVANQLSRARRLRNKAFGLPKTPAVQQAINNTKQAEAAAIAGDTNTARAKNNQAAAILNFGPFATNNQLKKGKNNQIRKNRATQNVNLNTGNLFKRNNKNNTTGPGRNLERIFNPRYASNRQLALVPGQGVVNKTNYGTMTGNLFKRNNTKNTTGPGRISTTRNVNTRAKLGPIPLPFTYKKTVPTFNVPR